MIANTLQENEYHNYYESYINKATDLDIVNGLSKNLYDVAAFYEAIPINKHEYVYAKDKWTIKELLLHIIDTERILVYRALRIARGDKTALAGFDQDLFVANAPTKSIKLAELIEDYKFTRQSTIALFKSFNSDLLLKRGEASGATFSVRALGYIITGHENHHNQIIKARYL